MGGIMNRLTDRQSLKMRILSCLFPRIMNRLTDRQVQLFLMMHDLTLQSEGMSANELCDKFESAVNKRFGAIDLQDDFDNIKEFFNDWNE